MNTAALRARADLVVQSADLLLTVAACIVRPPFVHPFLVVHGDLADAPPQVRDLHSDLCVPTSRRFWLGIARDCVRDSVVPALRAAISGA